MQTPDTKPGHYYVTAIDGPRVAFLLGPFVDNHGAALAHVDAAKREAEKVDPKAIWYAYGTVRLDASHPRAGKPGVLNHTLGL